MRRDRRIRILLLGLSGSPIVFVDKCGIEVCLDDAPALGNGTEHVIGQVARMVGQGAG